jgi:nucleotidyltransferase/DNA polymerase involved in DNA repair
LQICREDPSREQFGRGDFTPLVERISIDEAFADVAGTEHLFGTPAEIAEAIRRRVRTELGLPISVGVARTKHLAKIASQVAKPDGSLSILWLNSNSFTACPWNWCGE